MTWEEFKATVENAGVKDADEIDYVDMRSGWPIEIDRGPLGVEIFQSPPNPQPSKD